MKTADVASADNAGLSGRVAIVTGGSGGLGRAIVAKLKLAGARVVSFDRNEPPEGKDRPDLFCACDVTDPIAVQRAVDHVASTFGAITILVNNAGLQGSVAPVADISVDEWREVIDVNLTGTFLCCRAVIPQLVKAGWGRIITISSVQGKEGTAGAGAYAASKAGQIALTKSLAKELARDGVTVNCITPTVVEAGMFHVISEERRADLLARIPMGRFCAPEEVAAMVAWVASKECSFSTGAVFDLSGGRATW
jgi:NAD(P)-dependent dehydrogenase (short-subunit alcohol dehydrogenase family)